MQQLMNVVTLALSVCIERLALGLTVIIGAFLACLQKVDHTVHFDVRLPAPPAKPKHNIVHEVFYKTGLNCICEVREQG